MIDKFQGEYRWLSNFHETPISIEGETYPTTEHAYQALKTLDPMERASIREAKTPGKAKRLGQKVTLRPSFESVKISNMRRVTIIKFMDSELRDKLLATGDQELIEGNNWGDKFWGVSNGVGRNELGKILMEVRDLYKNGVKCVMPIGYFELDVTEDDLLDLDKDDLVEIIFSLRKILSQNTSGFLAKHHALSADE